MRYTPLLIEIMNVRSNTDKERLDAAGKSVAQRSINRALDMWRSYERRTTRASDDVMPFADYLIALSDDKEERITKLVGFWTWRWLVGTTELEEATLKSLRELLAEREGCEDLFITVLPFQPSLASWMTTGWTGWTAASKIKQREGARF